MCAARERNDLCTETCRNKDLERGQGLGRATSMVSMDASKDCERSAGMKRTQTSEFVLIRGYHESLTTCS